MAPNDLAEEDVKISRKNSLRRETSLEKNVQNCK